MLLTRPTLRDLVKEPDNDPLNRMSYPSPRIALQKLIKALCDQAKIYICTTGAATGIAELFTSIPGSSKIFLGAEVPYNQMLLADYIKTDSIPNAVSREVAVAMANESYLKGQDAVLRSGQMVDGKPSLIGIGMTAAIASGPRRGLDRMHIAIRTIDGIRYGHFEFKKGVGIIDRKWQDLAAKKIILNAALETAGIPQLRFNVDGITAHEGKISQSGISLSPLSPHHLTGDGPFLILPNATIGDPTTLNPNEHIIFPGSFRSFHCGHDAVARITQLITGKKVVFEISGSNVYKSDIDWNELSQRATQFAGRYGVILHKSAARFYEKSTLYPKGMNYVVGFDVAEKILDPKFYGDTTTDATQKRDEVLKQFKNDKVRFYVVGRALGADKFLTRDEMAIPHGFEELFIGLPSTRRDISSSALRGKAP